MLSNRILLSLSQKRKKINMKGKETNSWRRGKRNNFKLKKKKKKKNSFPPKRGRKFFPKTRISTNTLR
jgi:hypothetical protein